jgi:hypothetical protein
VIQIVKHRGVVIEGDDVAVWQLFLRLARLQQIVDMNLELRLPVAEGARRSAMSAHAAHVGLGEAGNLVVGLPRALEVQRVEQRLGIDLAAVQVVRLTDECRASALRKMFFRRLGRSDHANVEVLDPIPTRR